MKNLITSKIFLILFLFSILMPCCVFAQNAFDTANAMAQDALRRLEEVLSGNNSNNTAAAGNTSSRNKRSPASVTAPAEEIRGGKQPEWVDDPYRAYSRELFVAAVGFGPNRNEAASKALAGLVAYFGQSIKSDFTIVTNYSEAQEKGVVMVSESTKINDQIVRAASMENLIGAEIGNIWDSGRGTVYTAAYLDIAMTISIYSDLIVLNNSNINTLVTMNNTEKNTLDGYARYKLAAQIAGINANYTAIITKVGGNTSSLNLKTPESFNIEASNIIKNITVAIHVDNDRVNRIQDAFAKVLGGEGLRTRGNNPVYSLKVDVVTNEVTFPNNTNKFCRIELSANLIENSSEASLLTFSFNERFGHASYENAEAQVYLNAEKIIAERYKARLKEYLATLIPNN